MNTLVPWLFLILVLLSIGLGYLMVVAKRQLEVLRRIEELLQAMRKRGTENDRLD